MADQQAKPILFSGPMVRAILDGRKTVTRRVLKPQPDEKCLYHSIRDANRALRWAEGDRLWVRETWTHTGDGVWTIADARFAGLPGVRYHADGPIVGAKYWPSIHMPREFSRISLDVTSVKVERLQDISAADSVAEGVECETCAAMQASACGGNGCFSSLAAFRDLWSHINGPGSWDANPWVVAISFKRVTP